MIKFGEVECGSVAEVQILPRVADHQRAFGSPSPVCLPHCPDGAWAGGEDPITKPSSIDTRMDFLTLRAIHIDPTRVERCQGRAIKSWWVYGRQPGGADVITFELIFPSHSIGPDHRQQDDRKRP